MNFLEKKLKASARIPFERALKASPRSCRDYIGPMSPTSPMSSIWMRSARAGVSIGIDPLGGAAVQYWQPIIERYKNRGHGRERRGRSDLPVHDRRLGRKDPDGLFVALCDDAADRAAQTNSTSPSPTTPMPTATASSARRAA
jgi:phosphoglucomutase